MGKKQKTKKAKTGKGKDAQRPAHSTPPPTETKREALERGYTASLDRKVNAELIEAEREEGQRQGAALTLCPALQAAESIALLATGHNGTTAGISALTERLQQRLAIGETGIDMLAANAAVTNTLASTLLEKALSTKDGKHFDMYMRNYYKALSATRNALMAINEIKHLRIARYVGQVNQAGGHQQVNNGDAASVAENSDNVPNELKTETLGDIYENTGTQTTTGGEKPDS